MWMLDFIGNLLVLLFDLSFPWAFLPDGRCASDRSLGQLLREPSDHD